MGTRGMTIVHHEGKYKVSQYGQWDHYPSGQGATILTFMRDKFDREKFLARLADTFEPTEEQRKQWYADAGSDPNSQWITPDTSRRFKASHPSLDRDMGGDILEYIQDSTEPVPFAWCRKADHRECFSVLSDSAGQELRPCVASIRSRVLGDVHGAGGERGNDTGCQRTGNYQLTARQMFCRLPREENYLEIRGRVRVRFPDGF